ncbi:hypothetical protein [Peptoniphilus porci]|uniref:Uncharacterized protein n=1 Tax=Peptoniphilus porci TaxID=2652280 RepID=A0A1U7LYG6_9FIRM|nr:hypothetical protein [Peptoniphilus porci]OLR64465.1 hypothetical protein BIV18_02345 [Peptoniphilus porci]
MDYKEMNQATIIKEKYKNLKLPRKKSSDEILNWIEDRYDAYKINFSEYIRDNRVRFKFILMNWINDCEIEKFCDEILELVIYKIPKNKKTEIYFLGNEDSNKLDYYYLLFEKKTQLFSVDQHIIFEEVFLYGGITEKDKKEDSLKYLDYLTNIDFFYNYIEKI